MPGLLGVLASLGAEAPAPGAWAPVAADVGSVAVAAGSGRGLSSCGARA